MKNTKIILVTLALMACIAGPAAANYILLAPSGTTLSTAQVRAEAAISPDNDHGKYYWLATGLMQVELNVLQYNRSSGEKESRFGAQWSFLPETSFTPAVGFGVVDVASESDEGVGVYAAITKHLPIGLGNPIIKDLAVTAGVGAGGIRGPFFGAEAKLPLGLFLQAEYDSRDFNGAFGWQPVKLFRVKAYTIKDEFYMGAEIAPIRF